MILKNKKRNEIKAPRDFVIKASLRGRSKRRQGYGCIGGAPKHASAFLVLPSGSMKPPEILSIETENTAVSWAFPELEACFEELEHFAFVIKKRERSLHMAMIPERTGRKINALGADIQVSVFLFSNKRTLRFFCLG